MQRLNYTATTLSWWNKSHFDKAHERTKKAKLELKQFQDDGWGDKSIRLNLENKLTEQRLRLESIYTQQPWEIWFTNGDHNTQFFLASTLIRKRKNFINSIKDKECWLRTKEQISEYFSTKFHNLYMSSNPIMPATMEECGQWVILSEENHGLVFMLPTKEIKDCIRSLHPLKALHLDGFSSTLYRNY